MRLSVVVPVLNARTSLPGFLRAMEAQRFPADRREVLIVDNGSTDGTLESVRACRFPGLRLLLRHDRRGPYAARNLGVAAARGDVVAFTDADCLPREDWLEKGLARVAGGAARVAGRVHPRVSSAPTFAERLDATRFLRQDAFVKEGFGATANLFIAREVFDRMGPFDERFLSGGDYEYGRRATNAGIPIVYEPEAVVEHVCRRSFRPLARKAARVGFGFGQFLRLHGARSAPLLRRIRHRLGLAVASRDGGLSGARSGFSVAIAAGHLGLAACTAWGVARGLLARRPLRGRDDVAALASLDPS